jgi:flagellar hook-basal body complex protein FliE
MPVDLLGGAANRIAPVIPNELGAALPIPGSDGGQGKSFGDFLVQALGEVNQAQQTAGSTVQAFAKGAPIDIHQVMIALEQAGTSLALATQVRNKMVEAYQEVMHTQV